MNKYKNIIIFLLLCALLSSCKTALPITDESTGISEINVTTAVETEPAVSDDHAESNALAAFLRDNLPLIDGSTSTKPLEAGLRAAIFGISLKEAEKQVVHTSTYESFYKLIENKCDIIFSTPLSKQQYENAESYNYKLELVPIVREGFVFLVNADNPVESLTTEQIKDIYSGKITIWSEIGGRDEPIIAYQRNETSGSQNYMIEFMGDIPLADAPTELVPSMMNTLIDAVAVNDGSGGSIGYSVFAYADGMYNAGGRVKLIAVDGVSASYETIADGSYPCTGYNYAIFNSDTAEESNIRKLVKWLLTKDGQTAMSEAGYVPLNSDIPFPAVMEPELYVKTGTGESEYVPDPWYYTADIQTTDSETKTTEQNGRIFRDATQRLASDYAKVTEEINTFIDSAVSEFTAMAPDSDSSFAWNGNKPDISLTTEFSLVNGYLSVVVLRQYSLSANGVWDLYTGKRLTLSDLFEKDTDFIKQLNAVVKIYTEVSDDFHQSVELLRPFLGIEKHFSNFSLSENYKYIYNYSNGRPIHLNLYFSTGDNSYFDSFHTVMVSPRELDGFLVRTQRDMNGLLPSDTPAYLLQFAHEDNIRRMEKIGEYSDPNEQNTYGQRRWFDITGYAGADKINAARYKYISKNYDIYTIDKESTAATIKNISELYASNYGLKEGELLTRKMLGNCYVEINSDLTFIGEKYVIARNYAKATYGEMIGYGGGVEWGAVCFVYNLETGDEIMLDDILVDGWRGLCYWYDGIFTQYNDNNNAVKEPIGKITLTNVSLRTSGIEKYNIFNFIREDGTEVSAVMDISVIKR